MGLPLTITVDRINVDRRYSLDEEGPWPCERPDTLGELYRMLVKEYGRCTGHVYVGDGQKVGWVFLKREKYDDVDETFVCETWVTIYHAHPHDLLDLDHPDEVPAVQREATALAARATYAGVAS
jgi:hypothetical protein